MAEDTLPALEDCGFIRVPGTDKSPLWMTCEKCSKSDHFWIEGEQIRCRCGASYSHALRPDGEKVGLEDLTLVPFNKGPMSLADLEWDVRRLAIFGVVAVAGLAGLAWVLL